MRRIPFAIFLLVLVVYRSLIGSNDQIRFVDVTAQAGLLAPLEGMMGHAAAWGDVDADGDLDLYVGGFADRPDVEYVPARGPVPNRLFRNLGNGRFEAIAHPSGELYARTTSAVFADLDNDGKLDLLVANNRRTLTKLLPGVQRNAQLQGSLLFRNQQGTLIDVTAMAGDCLTLARSARSVGVLDTDADGLLDLLMLEDRFGGTPHSRLCRNMGGFKFTDVTAWAGLPADLHGLGLAIADLNEDGRPDIFVTHSNRLFMSTREGKYIEPAGPKARLAWKPLNAEDWPAGAVFADLNRDGRLDLVIGVHHDHARNRVFFNDGLEHGVPNFRDVSAEVGLPAYLNTKSPHVEVQDFDNDGWPDLYFSGAWLNADGSVTPLVFRNDGLQAGLPRFEPLRPISTDQPRFYFPAGPSGDYDGDGRIDLFLANWFRDNHARLLRNLSRPNGWLEVKVAGKAMNRMGIGAKVRVYKAGELGRPGGLLGLQEIGTGYGFASAQVPVAHFGLGSEASVDVAIAFPDGSGTVIRDVGTDRRLTVEGP